MAFGLLELGEAFPTPRGIDQILVGRWRGQQIALGPSPHGSTLWFTVDVATGITTLLEGNDAGTAQSSWLRNLRTKPVKVRWDLFTDAVKVPKPTMERWMAGRSIPYYRAVALSQWQRKRALDTAAHVHPELPAALELPWWHDGHFNPLIFELLVELSANERDAAVNMILHPEFDLRTLNPRQAADAIAEVISRPRKAQEAWDAQRKKLRADWTAKLGNLALKGTRRNINVVVAAFDDTIQTRHRRGVEDNVNPRETTPHAPPGLIWLHLAVRYGAEIKILPDANNPGASIATVDEIPLRVAEQAAADGGQKSWLRPNRPGVGSGRPLHSQ